MCGSRAPLEMSTGRTSTAPQVPLSVVASPASAYHPGLPGLLEPYTVAAGELDERVSQRGDELARPGREREADAIAAGPLHLRGSPAAGPVPVARVLIEGARARAGTHEHLPGERAGHL